VAKFPVDAPIRDVIRALERLGFVLVREGNHVSMVRVNADRTKTTLTMPNHRTLKASTLRTILSQASIARDDFLREYNA
jgi:predicted RNA binding protein YcfA (HicA-like mRNA interferase family)